MEKFILNITASSGEFFQGECESLTLPTADGQYGVQAGHSPVLISIRTVPRPPASAPRNACSTSRACTSITRARLP